MGTNDMVRTLVQLLFGQYALYNSITIVQSLSTIVNQSVPQGKDRHGTHEVSTIRETGKACSLMFAYAHIADSFPFGKPLLINQ
jgi:hypothetical protein